MDSGADISILKENLLDHTLERDLNKIISLQGITSLRTKTLGSVQTSIFLTPTYSVKQEFYLVQSNFPISCDAILGTDFLTKSKAIIDFGKNGILLFNQVWLKFQTLNIHESNKALLPCNMSSVSNSMENLKMFLEFNQASMIDTREDLNSYHDSYKDYLVEYGFPVPKLFNALAKIMCWNDDIASKIGSTNTAVVLNININNLSRDEKILNLVGIGAESDADIIDINKILLDYADIFHLEGELLRSTDSAHFKIPLIPGTVPLNFRKYRLSPKQNLEVRKQVSQLLANNIIRHSCSPWNAPVLLVPKKSDVPGVELQRLVFDYRGLNTKIVKDSYPLPLIADILDSINGSKFF